MTAPRGDEREPKPCPRCGEVCTHDGWGHVHRNGIGIGSCAARGDNRRDNRRASEGHYDAPTGADLIAAERRRQVEAEGWTPEHDAWHIDDDLAMAAVCYALPPTERRPRHVFSFWPWHSSWWKPTPDDRVRELVKAGALIAAEIDRLRAQALARADRGITS